jgi:cysteine desulfurase/selenocysteine lyase
VHRGAHYLADQATRFYEESRQSIADFISASSPEEIIFTKGTTESINLVAQSFGRNFLKAGDEILITEMEHHANIVPWQMLCQQVGCLLKVAPVDENGELQIQDFKKLLNEKTKLVAVTHCSNTLGTINDVKLLSQLAHQVGAKILIDGAQMVSANVVNVQDIDADFYVFSGHKLFGPYGVGVLYGKKDLLEKMPPYQGGGSMISEVTFAKTTYNDIPFKFEAGTPNIEAVIAMKAAIDYVKKLGFANIHQHEMQLLKYATEKLSEIPDLKIIGQAKNKGPILSFNLGKIHHSDVGQALDQQNIAVRTGHHCTQPLLAKLGYSGTVRASFSVFNNKADIDALFTAVQKAKELFL